MEIVLYFIAGIVGVLVIIPICYWFSGTREKTIHEKIESMGGKVDAIERRNFFSGIGPFTIVGKNKVVYRIVYRVNDQRKEIWVRFGGLLGPEWREGKGE